MWFSFLAFRHLLTLCLTATEIYLFFPHDIITQRMGREGKAAAMERKGECLCEKGMALNKANGKER